MFRACSASKSDPVKQCSRGAVSRSALQADLSTRGAARQPSGLPRAGVAGPTRRGAGA